MQRQPRGCDVRDDLPPGPLTEAVGGDLLGSFLEDLPLGVYVCDAGGRITYWNRQAERLWGRAPAPGDREDALCAAMPADAIPVSSHGGREFLFQRPDGTRAAVLAFAKEVRDKADRLLGTVNIFVDLTEQKQVQHALLQRERELTDFFENATVGLHWAAADGTILRANRYELDMLGYQEQEYVGRRFREFHEDPALADRLLERLRAGENLCNCEARLRCKDGTVRDVIINSNVLWDNGRFVHSRCFTRDITPFRKAGEALIAADQRKTEFLASLAQALRSPLSTIRSVVGFLGMGDRSDAERVSAQEVCDRQLAHLMSVVDDLADVAKITGGTLRMRKERVSLAEIIGNAVEASSAAVERAGQALRLSLPQEPVVLEGDPVRLAQVFQNLLDNAARFSAPGGTITVSAGVEDGAAEAGSANCACVTVSDTGMGIARERLPQLFDLFYQGHEGGRRPGEGLGIGLAIARAIVEKHGGRIEAHSDGPGSGSEFRLHLPVSAASAGAHREAGARRRVLVVDDNEDSAVIMSMLLNYMGHETRTAFAGQAALATAAEYRPDAVLMDIGLPELDGYEVCRRIRSQPWGRDMVLVAVTGWGHDEDKQRAREAGFDDHLTKPADLDELRRVLA